MATRPARLLTGYGGNLLTGYGGNLLTGYGYPEVDVPDETTLPVGPLFRPAPRNRADDLTDDDLLALMATLLLTA